MDIATYSIKKPVITWMIVVVTILFGIFAYTQLGRYEDPQFTIKEALVFTQYPGATPQEVAKEVTEKLEESIQQMSQIDYIKSLSNAGMSEITVVIDKKYTSKDLPQIWDELRRKVNDVQSKLPPGAGPSIVNDDYSDVFGMLYAVTGDGFNFKQLDDFAEEVQKQLLIVPGVAKVSITGMPQETIFLNLNRTKMAQLGIPLENVFNIIKTQNAVTDAGHAKIGDEYIRITMGGKPEGTKDIGNILIRSPKTKAFIRLSDIAKINYGYKEVPRSMIYYNNKPALNIGISFAPGGNVVKIGEVVQKRLKEILVNTPIGINLHPVYEQPAFVVTAIKNFMVSLGEALAIVLAVLLLAMGLRSGLIIGVILLLTILATFCTMFIFDINLQRISLGALIIALGMLVDNAIVVTEGILVKIQQGVERLKACQDVVKQTLWPLFGATVVGVLAFSAIGLSQDSTGEYARSLFYVLLISLLFSWFFAVTAAPLFCHLFLTPGKTQKDPYKNIVYRGYKGLLNMCLRFRWVTVAVVVGMFALALWGFQFVKPGFFPNSTTPYVMVNYWQPQGTDIRTTARKMLEVQKYISSLPEVAAVSSYVGSGALRFTLVYSPEKANPGYGQFLIRVKDYATIPVVAKKARAYIEKHHLSAEVDTRFFELGPGAGYKIEARLSGPDPIVLRKLVQQVRTIYRKNPHATDIREDWRQKVKVIKPIYSETMGRTVGLTRQDISDAIKIAVTGKSVGIYRKGKDLIPIVARWPEKERQNIANIADIYVWSTLLQTNLPITQAITQFKTVWEDAIINHRNRLPTITISCNSKDIPAGILFRQLRPLVEGLKLPPRYTMEWGGEFENATKAKTGIFSQLPASFFLMFIIVVFLFGTMRQPIVIWLTVPLSIIGVSFGLLITNNAFEFMALLGFLSLSGMLIKNAVVLVDQIDLEIKEGKQPKLALIDSSMSRMRPVVLAAITTILGMIPLLFDAFFESMSITIMFGLGFATILTLLIVPVFYAIFFRIKYKEAHETT
ncbi:MAG: efflux RND transporter permease subunit [Gammaproteobacteria bacterium]|nr:efflux RND transporter permease subunit [Gammaproteobacteria bacterium]